MRKRNINLRYIEPIEHEWYIKTYGIPKNIYANYLIRGLSGDRYPSELTSRIPSKFSSYKYFKILRSRIGKPNHYVLGGYGSGRWYLNDLILQKWENGILLRDHLSSYFHDLGLIQSGHFSPSNMYGKYFFPASSNNYLLSDLRDGKSRAIHMLRNPLSAALTNWIWTETLLKSGRFISGISEVFPSYEAFAQHLSHNFKNFIRFQNKDIKYWEQISNQNNQTFPSFGDFIKMQIEVASLPNVSNLHFEEFNSKNLSGVSETIRAVLDLPKSITIKPPRSKNQILDFCRKSIPEFRNWSNDMLVEYRNDFENLGYL